MVLLYGLGNEISLVCLVHSLVPVDLVALLACCPESLCLTSHVVADNRVCGIEDGLGRAVILLKAYHLGACELVLEAEDVLDICATEFIYALVVVADYAEVLV